ncbi:hypothetical protein JM946_00965 [Steroidobacter sp. S1-65]|uniref:Cytochrome c domain-containing protein n=1 Tax=Steroidobacter gossypii TaxID=2805490 RepID=A0ABS1WQP3_9GAMM|nr:hypothetical protein [Steroidobacter gossypii]MBM0103288.1 hypothetical protein [Steroidobacter gossypii]
MKRVMRMLGAITGVIAPALAMAASPPGAASCLGCHTVNGGDNPVPPIGALEAEQIVSAMQAFRTGARPATVMDRVAKGFSDEEIKAIAQWYASAKPK